MGPKKSKNFQAFLPNPAQESLLKAALLEGEEAVLAWRAYLNQVDFDKTDYGSSRLLPLVYRNFQQMGHEAPYLGRMKGIYRLTWAENQKKFQTLSALLQAFREAQIPALLLKGAALTLLCYRDFGLRGMGDLDLAVPVSKALEAVAILEKLNWSPELEFQKIQVALHAAHFKSPHGEDLDLHWHILFRRCEEEYDRLFWEGARPVLHQGESLLTLQPSDHLLHACIHGAAWSPSSPLRWVADCIFLIRNCEIDWERILRLAAQLHMVPTLQATLPYLTRFTSDIPAEFLARLAAIESPQWQHDELEVLCRPIGFFGVLPILWNRHSQLRASDRLLGRYRGFPNFLKHYYAFDSYRDLGKAFLRKGWKKLNVMIRSRKGPAEKTI